MNYNELRNRLVVLVIVFFLTRHLAEGTRFSSDKKFVCLDTPKGDFLSEFINAVQISTSNEFNLENCLGQYLNSSVNKNTENFDVSRRFHHRARQVLHFASVSDYPNSE